MYRLNDGSCIGLGCDGPTSVEGGIWVLASDIAQLFC